ncbi:unnamed protein product [Symbiodinium necroappetens]|uniref:Uncharacterized protein n=1 Tax=Symbiodinium necroappetens TaxID=1628268 RepID=A0A812MEG7_9DINO|nr:unnamed protein product [Symbiodinium necroappetens]
MDPHDRYGYEEALSARMVKFGEEEVCVMDSDEDEDDYNDQVFRGFRFPEPVPRHQISTLHLDEHGVHGHSLSGEVLFEIRQSRSQAELFTAGMLLELISEETGCEAGVLLRDGSELSMSDPVGGEGVLTLKQTIRDYPTLLCRKIGRGGNPMLREGEVHPDLRDVAEPVQALKELRTWVTRDFQEMFDQEECWLVYAKRQVVSYEAGRYEPLKPFGYFPQAPLWKLPAGTRQWGGARSDVWSTCLKLPVRQLLDEHAALTLDRPIPRYQMIVDPNQFVHQTRDGPVWVPCEFDISADGTASLVGGTRSHANPHLAQHVAGPVLSAALPLLAKLRRPQLLLNDRRLQVVFKAQRIIVPGDAGDNSDAEYVGLWHVDGHRENVAAVVLYYYHVDSSLRGGDMELCGREPMDVLGFGDCSNNVSDLGSKSLREALRGGSKSDQSSAVHNCRVPIGNGTLLVFSNYQMAHRVLRLKNTGSTEASRDFVALFVLDPSSPALLPARSILAAPHLLRRTLAPVQMSESAIQNVLEFLGVSQTDVERKIQRNRLLSEQLKPSGEFACGGKVYATGNGCYTMIGWLHNMLEHRGGQAFEGMNPEGFERLAALNLPPKGSDRGLSEVLSLPTSKLQRRLRHDGSEDSD